MDLDALEGFPSYYLKKQVRVFHNGQPTECMVYYMNNDCADELPSDSYLAMLYEGYAEYNVNTEQITESLNLITSIKQRQIDLQAKYFQGC